MFQRFYVMLLLKISQGRTGSDHSSNRSYRMTLEEQRAIQEEVRSTGIAEASDKVQVLRDEKAAEKTVQGVGPPVPGDSGFCSEQDQHAQQGQGIQALYVYPFSLPGRIVAQLSG